VAEETRIVLRIGINLGDVMVEGSDLYGDGVNVASRLEAATEPGTVLVSESVFAQVKGKVPVHFEDAGEHQLKNIAAPIRAYRAKPAVLEEKAREVAVLSLPKRPSIAVLPFTNMGGDAEQQYFSDGVTEDIITQLSRFKELFVIARNSSFQYRDKSNDVKEVGRQLGVQYVLEGSVRRAGNRVRITSQLIEARTANHIWADRYDRNLDDIFAVQDEVSQTIVATLAGRVAASTAESIRRKPPQLWAAYDYFLQGREQALFRYDPDAAKPLLRHAIDLDPSFAQAHAVLAFSLVLRFFTDMSDRTLNEASEEARIALSLDENDPWPHLAMGFACTFLRHFDLAGVHHAKAVALNPNDAQAAFLNAHWLSRVGRTNEAVQELDRAVRLDPFMPDIYWEARAIALMQARRHQEVIDSTNRMNKLAAGNHYFLASAYAHLGKLEEAREHARKVLEMRPNYTENWVRRGEPYENVRDIEHLLEGLRKAGLLGSSN
jgi:TolB-like protein/Flp pilus assembly protein TadD